MNGSLSPEEYKRLAEKIFRLIPARGTIKLADLVAKASAGDDSGYGASDAKSAFLHLKEQGRVGLSDSGIVSRKKQYFAIVDPKDGVVWGTGTSEKSARKDAKEWIDDYKHGLESAVITPLSEMTCHEITEERFRHIDAMGGEVGIYDSHDILLKLSDVLKVVDDGTETGEHYASQLRNLKKFKGR